MMADIYREVISELQKGVATKNKECGSSGWEYDVESTNRLMQLAAIYLEHLTDPHLNQRAPVAKTIEKVLKTEPVAWRVRVKSADPEEWAFMPAGGGADYLDRDGYECQPLYTSATVLDEARLSEAQIYAQASNIIQVAMGKINQVSGDRRRASRVWAANEDPLAYVMGVEAIVELVHRAAFSSAETPTTSPSQS